MKIGKLKVVQMRKELEARGLDISGNRPALMKRLREALEKERSNPDITHIPERIEPDDPERQPTYLRDEQRAHGKKQQRDRMGGRLAEEPHHSDGNGYNMNKGRERSGEGRYRGDANEVREREQVRETQQQEQQQARDPPRSEKLEESGTEGQGLNVEQNVDTHQVPSASGNLVVASKINQEERLRNRRERFGAIERVLTPAEAKKEELRRFEELKRRRAAKFGPTAPIEKKTTSAGGISDDERERRLKRQRRFQTIGNATAV